ncbi:RpiB/LacA/LacB family sugar-phosphate isomerase [Candidatus Kaiserbacteria bacterium]|nr:MAG: RpiB/LacA/LacB family sugar-phosphate isomerase [Candidatus Kaiserbacteria bacterium]
MKVFFATDHAGFELKEQLLVFVSDLGYEVEDLGAHEYVGGDDYPEYIARAAERVSQHPDSKAIIFGGSGQGEAIVANRFKGVRAVVWYGGGTGVLTASREHNDANVLSIGARFVDITHAQEAVKIWLETEFTHDERHVRRIEKIEKVLHT